MNASPSNHLAALGEALPAPLAPTPQPGPRRLTVRDGSHQPDRARHLEVSCRP